METNNPVLPFSFEDQNEVRIMMIDDEPWFVAKDVCEILGYDTRQKRESALRKLDIDEKLSRKISDSGQMREMILINESGLYALTIRSYKPEAKVFRKWVTSVVLPQIRKTGSYALKSDWKQEIYGYLEIMFIKFKAEISAEFVKDSDYAEQIDDIYAFAADVDVRFKQMNDLIRSFSQFAQSNEQTRASVYVMYNRQTDEYKIGQSASVKTRQRQLQQVEPNIELILTIPLTTQRMANYLERMLHEKFTFCHTHGEWYKLKPPDLDIIKMIAEVLGEAQF